MKTLIHNIPFIKKSLETRQAKSVVTKEHVDRAIAEGMKDYAEGRFDGPFRNVEEFRNSL